MGRPIVVLAAAAALVCAGTALAITHGQFDGSGHPEVGALIYRAGDGSYQLLCSGSLISPTVFLTAAHCSTDLDDQPLTDVWVTFDPTFGSSSTLIHGTMHANPLFNKKESDPEDIAVVVLDTQVNATPVQLPTAGLLDRMKKNGTLNGTRFTSVGYGDQQPENGPGGHTYPFTSQRQVASGEFNSLQDAWLKLSQNGATGDGGTCYGDSGGPQFLGSGSAETKTQVSITISGDSVCKATNLDYRLDTPQARAFLGQYVTLP